LTTPAAFCSEASERHRLISRTSFNSSPAQGQPHDNTNWMAHTQETLPFW
jgi:hypothetical protein